MIRRYYEILEISEDATQDQIKKAFRRMSSKLHPDKIGSQREVTEADTRAFQAVIEAYECLSDEEKRIVYDETGSTGKEENPMDGVLMHVFKQLIEAGAPTAFDLLGTTLEVLEGMIQEAHNKLVDLEASLKRVKKIQEKVDYQGKSESPILPRVFEEVILTLQKEIEEHQMAVSGAKMAHDHVREYKARDRSAKPQKSRESEMPEELRLLDAMLRNRIR